MSFKTKSLHRWIRTCTTSLFACTAVSILIDNPAYAAEPWHSGDNALSPFYRWEESIPSTPGQILRSEPLPIEHQLKNAQIQDRILYSSVSGLDSTSIIVSGQVYIPKGTPPEGGWPLLAWAHGTVGVADSCAPSWNRAPEVYKNYLNRWLEQGYAIVATDYEGLGTPGLHPYLTKRSEAYGVLDSIRSVIGERYPIANKVIVAGQSQGGGAAFATAGFAKEYAPEVDIKGTIVTGIPYLTERTMTVSGVDPNRIDPGIAYMFYVALVAHQREASLKASSLFTEKAMPLFDKASRTCVGALAQEVIQVGLTQANAVQPEAVKTMARVLLPQYSFNTLKLDHPLFVGTGTADMDVRPEGQQLLIREACNAGTTVEAHLYKGQSHTGAWLTSLNDALAFARAVMIGTPIQPTCSTPSS
jgi:pimeloyl-ACP methyl ester carboxylesterase